MERRPGESRIPPKQQLADIEIGIGVGWGADPIGDTDLILEDLSSQADIGADRFWDRHWSQRDGPLQSRSRLPFP